MVGSSGCFAFGGGARVSSLLLRWLAALGVFGGAVGILADAAGGPLAARRAWAQEAPSPVANGAANSGSPSGLAVVAAIENALVSAIATAEKSVVAIARVKRGERDDVEIGIRSGPFGPLSPLNNTPKPGDADFIPNDFGAGVVVDRNGLILTHFHVVGEDSDLYVTTPARKVYLARVKAADPRSDLAVLRRDQSAGAAFYALDARTTPMTCSFISIGINLLLNGVFTYWLNWGPRGLAFSTSCHGHRQFHVALRVDAAADGPIGNPALNSNAVQAGSGRRFAGRRVCAGATLPDA